MYRKEFAAACVRLRSSRNMTQAELGDAVGCDRSYISRIEDAKGGGEDVRRAIATAFGTTYEDMLVLGRGILSSPEGAMPLGVEVPLWFQNVGVELANLPRREQKQIEALLRAQLDYYKKEEPPQLKASGGES